MTDGKGMLVSIGSVVVAETSTIIHQHVPTLIMDVFQCLAWLGAICVSVVTVHGWWKKNFK